MKVKLLARKGNNKKGAVVEYDDTTAQWMVRNGYAEPVKASAKEDTDSEAPAPRRGRPPKAAQS